MHVRTHADTFGRDGRRVRYTYTVHVHIQYKYMYMYMYMYMYSWAAMGSWMIYCRISWICVCFFDFAYTMMNIQGVLPVHGWH